MNTRVRQLVIGFLNARRQRPFAVRGIAGAYGDLSKEEYEAHTATGDAPAVYVGTYAKYNDGNLFGQWVDIASFDDYDEFMDYLHRLHADEADPEFMMQDYENYPRQWYYESGMSEETFDNIKNYAELSENEAFRAYVDYYGVDDFNEDDFNDRYEGAYESEEDFAYWLVDEIGLENIQNKENYFDYSAFARDLFLTDFDFVDGYVFRSY